MSRVSYQVMLDGVSGAPAAFVPLPTAAFVTRRKHATASVSVAISPEQRSWLKRTVTAGGCDADAVVRAALDLMMALEVEWSSVGSPSDLREALSAAVRVRLTA